MGPCRSEISLSAGLLESVFLQVRILVGSGNPSMANPHTIPLSQNAAVVSGFEMLISRQVLQQLLGLFASLTQAPISSLENGGF